MAVVTIFCWFVVTRYRNGVTCNALVATIRNGVHTQKQVINPIILSMNSKKRKTTEDSKGEAQLVVQQEDAIELAVKTAVLNTVIAHVRELVDDLKGHEMVAEQVTAKYWHHEDAMPSDEESDAEDECLFFQQFRDQVAAASKELSELPALTSEGYDQLVLRLGRAKWYLQQANESRKDMTMAFNDAASFFSEQGRRVGMYNWHVESVAGVRKIHAMLHAALSFVVSFSAIEPHPEGRVKDAAALQIISAAVAKAVKDLSRVAK